MTDDDIWFGLKLQWCMSLVCHRRQQGPASTSCRMSADVVHMALTAIITSPSKVTWHLPEFVVQFTEVLPETVI
jgi:hypothetical protein